MDGFDWSKYAVGGAAARGDSFSGLNQDYASRIAALVSAADAELGPGALKITSAYRSPEVQERLFRDAVAKYGSEEAARKWVAPAGKSQHNFGLAVDFADASGNLLRDPDSREARWIAQNAARFGLSVPMSWEPWQVELADGRSGGSVPTQSRFRPMPSDPEKSDFARGYTPAQQVEDLYRRPENRIDPLSLYNPFEIAERFRIK